MNWSDNVIVANDLGNLNISANPIHSVYAKIENMGVTYNNAIPQTTHKIYFKGSMKSVLLIIGTHEYMIAWTLTNPNPALANFQQRALSKIINLALNFNSKKVIQPTLEFFYKI